MAPPVRLLNGAALACAGVALGGTTCATGSQFSGSRAEELAYATIGTGVFIGLLAVALAVATSAEPFRRLGLARGRLSALQVAVLAIGTVALSYGLDGVLEWTKLRESSALADLDAALVGTRGRALVVAAFGFALFPAVAEELLCRGVVQRGLELRYGAVLAIALSSVFFGALHLEPVHAVVAGLLGVYLGLVAWLAGSIRASIACHLVNNLAAVVTASLAAPEPGGPITHAAGFGVAALALALVWRRAGRPPPLAPERNVPMAPENDETSYSSEADRTNS